jgi:hypothetical protein
MAKREDERLAAAIEAVRLEWGSEPKPSEAWVLGYFARKRAGPGDRLATALAAALALYPDVDAIEFKRGWGTKAGRGAVNAAIHTLQTVKHEDGNSAARQARRRAWRDLDRFFK